SSSPPREAHGAPTFPPAVRTLLSSASIVARRATLSGRGGGVIVTSPWERGRDACALTAICRGLVRVGFGCTPRSHRHQRVGTARVSERTLAPRVSKGMARAFHRLLTRADVVPSLTRGALVRLLTRAVPTRLLGPRRVRRFPT